MLKLFGLLATTSMVVGAIATDASAAITITEAKISAGLLTVSGVSTTGTAVTLDGQFQTTLGPAVLLPSTPFIIPRIASSASVR